MSHIVKGKSFEEKNKKIKGSCGRA